MAVRLRKMARELERSTDDLLRMLRDLGFDRFKSEDDMLSEPVADAVRKAAKSRPARATWSGRVTSPPSPPRLVSAPTAAPDLMAALVPGVVRVGARPGPAARPVPATPEIVEDPVERVAALPELEQIRHELELARERLAASTGREQELRVALAAVTGERDQASVELEALRGRPLLAPSDLPTVHDLLEERGLRGLDESERALAALAGARLLGRLLDQLRCEDPEALRRLLVDRIVLVGGPIPENIGSPVVTVSPDRADLPALEVISRALARIGEQLLLNGGRRVLLVGVSPRWHGIIRDGVDRRVELAFRAVYAEDAGKHDLVVGWNVDLAGEHSRPRRIPVRAASFGEFLDRWSSALNESD